LYSVCQKLPPLGTYRFLSHPTGGIAEAAERVKLVPAIGRTAPLSEGMSAIVELEKTGSPKGKLVIVPKR